jgi:hypothetical protein
LQSGALEGLAEAFADVAVVEAAAERVGEDEVVWCLVAAGEPLLAQAPGERRGEDDLAPSCLGLEPGVFTAAGELPVDADQSGLVVDVGPGEAECLPDARAGVREELEQQPVGACVFEQLRELVGFEDRGAFWCPCGLSADGQGRGHWKRSQRESDADRLRRLQRP